MSYPGCGIFYFLLSTNIRITTLDVRRADFGLFSDPMGYGPGEKSGHWDLTDFSRMTSSKLENGLLKWAGNKPKVAGGPHRETKSCWQSSGMKKMHTKAEAVSGHPGGVQRHCSNMRRWSGKPKSRKRHEELQEGHLQVYWQQKED